MFANLDKFQSIDVDGDWNVVKDRIGFQKSRRISIIWRVAAIAILVLGVGFLAKQYIFTSPATIIAMTGEDQKEVILPDGSQVFLNIHTELTYPEKFSRNNRQVKLTGQGFFEVTKDPAKPFLVNAANRANVEVLGTSFNINAGAENESVRVQVVEGKVAFYANENEVVREILGKDDQAEMQNGVITKNAVRDKNFLSWKTGIIYFEQEGIVNVMDILGNHYNRELILDGTVDDGLTFTSTIDNQELESVLEELSLILGISYSFEDNKVLIHMKD
ncbi:MAG: FecR domain-containing protein [Bacteroidales bacterium]|nr:FecR domain-containing protein [Bacteroidales bacterium]